MEKSANQSLLQNSIEKEIYNQLETISIGKKYALYQTIFFKALSKMKRGSIRVILPDGTQSSLGDPDSDFEPKFHSAIIYIKDPKFFKRSVLHGDIGFSESFLMGEWETDSIENVVSWFILNVDDSPSLSGAKKKLFHLDLFNFCLLYTSDAADE